MSRELLVPALVCSGLFPCAFNHVVEAATIADAKLAVNIAHMVLGGAFRNGEFVADVLYGAPANEQLEHFGFACGKPGSVDHDGALGLNSKRHSVGGCA